MKDNVFVKLLESSVQKNVPVNERNAETAGKKLTTNNKKGKTNNRLVACPV